jgi:hypothetical protein
MFLPMGGILTPAPKNFDAKIIEIPFKLLIDNYLYLI